MDVITRRVLFRPTLHGEGYRVLVTREFGEPVQVGIVVPVRQEGASTAWAVLTGDASEGLEFSRRSDAADWLVARADVQAES